ncbi:helix-turn-helix domain-containing protein [Streptomyces alkaliphilus]|uniref:Helix-turn-helix domain-containing protein n=1 Tax=Streptomyces alkaliphilus TaxID=1472722 RepID=A0A7W3T9I2_9ACTN|nr:helix-turn-helix domain-containing protein [Streptomyces alkaliphilus]MBB0242693.1 helix-turn-helix domain-containing protein [Streptomyces alkaliphilus]
MKELTEAYRGGATLKELARRYGLHRSTVDRHLERAGVHKRPMVKMTPARVAEARKPYEQGWSTARIGRELYVDASTVCKTLKRAGVQMRPPVA